MLFSEVHVISCCFFPLDSYGYFSFLERPKFRPRVHPETSKNLWIAPHIIFTQIPNDHQSCKNIFEGSADEIF